VGTALRIQDNNSCTTQFKSWPEKEDGWGPAPFAAPRRRTAAGARPYVINETP
jgi:hypothetical protein